MNKGKRQKSEYLAIYYTVKTKSHLAKLGYINALK